ncbi:17139_t:CDS:2 [Funneliformis geosporum]|nr:17139_t:CDS:2 [Funneliformis geosporum]
MVNMVAVKPAKNPELVIDDVNPKIKRYYGYAGSEDVALKSLNNSQNMTLDFLTEVINNKLTAYNIVRCHGISQDPVTKNYVMIMDYMSRDIAKGLNTIHEQNLIHRDLHSGNVLNKEGPSHISDLGISRPVNFQKEEGKIFGVLPYVAPEVLQDNPYTKASDIYSFGIIAYELFANAYPYTDLKILYPELKDEDELKKAFILDQYQTIKDEYNHFSANTLYRIYPQTITHSQPINTKQIAQLFKKSEEQALELEIKKIEQEINQSFTDKQKRLVSNFIQIYKKREKGNREITKKDIKNLKDELRENNFLDDEKIKKIVDIFENNMVNNQIEFNKKFDDKKIDEIGLGDEEFEGHLVIEDYLELKNLCLRDNEYIEEIVLRNLEKLEISLEFIKGLDNLEELELDGNNKLSEILEPYEEKEKNNLFIELNLSKKELDSSKQKYAKLKGFLKETFDSLSQEAKKELVEKLDREIATKGKDISAPGMTEDLKANVRAVIESAKEIKKELEEKLVKSEEEIKNLKGELAKLKEVGEEKGKVLERKKSALEELKKRMINRYKLEEEGQSDLDILLENQKESFVKGEGDRTSTKNLKNSKEGLKRDFGIVEAETDELCQFQKEITRLETELGKINERKQYIQCIMITESEVHGDIKLENNEMTARSNAFNDTEAKIGLTRINELEAELKKQRTNYNRNQSYLETLCKNLQTLKKDNTSADDIQEKEQEIKEILEAISDAEQEINEILKQQQIIKQALSNRENLQTILINSAEEVGTVSLENNELIKEETVGGNVQSVMIEHSATGDVALKKNQAILERVKPGNFQTISISDSKKTGNVSLSGNKTTIASKIVQEKQNELIEESNKISISVKKSEEHRLERSNISGKYAITEQIGNIVGNTGSAIGAITFGVPKAAGEIIIASNNFLKINSFKKSGEEFQIFLLDDENELSKLEDAFNSLNGISSHNQEIKDFIDNLKPKKGLVSKKVEFFGNNKYKILDVLIDDDILVGQILKPDKMEKAVISIEKNLDKLWKDLDQQFNSFGKEFISNLISDQKIEDFAKRIELKKSILDQLVSSAKVILGSKNRSLNEKIKRNEERQKLLDNLKETNNEESLVSIRENLLSIKK